MLYDSKHRIKGNIYQVTITTRTRERNEYDTFYDEVRELARLGTKVELWSLILPQKEEFGYTR